MWFHLRYLKMELKVVLETFKTETTFSENPRNYPAIAYTFYFKTS